MARGWESKAVESQQEDAGRQRARGPLPPREDPARADRRRGLELSRARALADLQRATAPAHRRMLEAAIAALDRHLASLE